MKPSRTRDTDAEGSSRVAIQYVPVRAAFVTLLAGAGIAIKRSKSVLLVSVFDATSAPTPSLAFNEEELRSGSGNITLPPELTEYVPLPLTLTGPLVPFNCCPRNEKVPF